MSEGETVPNEQAPENAGEEPAATVTQPHVPAEIRDVAFPAAVRGYSRRSVDAYVQKVNRVIAELEVSRSPQAAVRHALDRVSDQTRGILEEARQAAEEIAASARQEAEQTLEDARSEAQDSVGKARAEAAEVMERARAAAQQKLERSEAAAANHKQKAEEEVARLRREAEAGLSELRSQIAAAREERAELLAQIERVATRLGELAHAGAEEHETGAAQTANEPAADEATEARTAARAFDET
jgi:DivIVA domain-containing protein